jgi:hypothetical protein
MIVASNFCFDYEQVYTSAKSPTEVETGANLYDTEETIQAANRNNYLFQKNCPGQYSPMEDATDEHPSANLGSSTMLLSGNIPF